MFELCSLTIWGTKPGDTTATVSAPYRECLSRDLRVRDLLKAAHASSAVGVSRSSGGKNETKRVKQEDSWRIVLSGLYELCLKWPGATTWLFSCVATCPIRFKVICWKSICRNCRLPMKIYTFWQHNKDRVSSYKLFFRFASCCYLPDKGGLQQMVRLSLLVPLPEFKDQLIKPGHFHVKGRARWDFSPYWRCAEVPPVNAKAARHRIDLGNLV